MDRDLLSILFIASLMVLLALGIPIGITVLILAGAGIMLVSNIDSGLALATAVFSQFSSWSLTALPLFVLMGEILARTGVAAKIFKAMAILIGRAPGGLIQVNVLASGLFSALSGSSTATVATIGKLSYPELEARGYSQTLSLGSLASAGTLGILIPPSVALVLYGFTFDVSIADLFLAGILPGIILMLMFSTYVAIAHRNIDATNITDEPQSKLRAIIDMLPLLALIFIVFGSIYGGFATPTESAVIGVVGGMIIAAFNRTLHWDDIVLSLRDTVMFSGAIGFVLGASAALQVAMAYTGIPREIVSWMQAVDMGPYGLLFILAIILLIMGCFIDGLSMIVLTGAVMLPVVKAAGIDLLWFGIYMVILVEIGLITPPIGFNLFVLQKLTGVSIITIGRGALPFIGVMLLALLLFTIFPQIVTFLPNYF
ncbi:MAG: TRAP transporter large permease subunit [Mesorhizobium sp.]